MIYTSSKLGLLFWGAKVSQNKGDAASSQGLEWNLDLLLFYNDSWVCFPLRKEENYIYFLRPCVPSCVCIVLRLSLCVHMCLFLLVASLPHIYLSCCCLAPRLAVAKLAAGRVGSGD